MSKRLVILPTFNEAENIKILIPQIFNDLPDCAVLVIDDGSEDDTYRIATELANIFPNLTAINRGKKLGLGSAYRLGFQWGLSHGFEELIQMDADLSHRVTDLMDMLELKSRIGADVLIGSRWIKGGATTNWSRKRVYLSRAANLVTRITLGHLIRDWTSGFRIYSAKLIRKIEFDSITSDGYSFQIEMTKVARTLGALIVEYPIVFKERIQGKSKMTVKIIFEATRKILFWGLQRFLNIKNWKYFFIRLFIRNFPKVYRLIIRLPLLLREIIVSKRQQLFSQFGEDEILTRICPDKGFYLDIGSGRPVTGSNTFALYQRGWVGILVDPLSINEFLSRYLRKRDFFIQTLIGDGTEVTLYEFYPYQFSTSSQEVARKLQDAGMATLVDKVTLVSTSVDSLLGLIPLELPLLLNIDCEGYDFEVLKSFPIRKYNPKVICIEDWLFDKEVDSPIHKTMCSFGYELIYRRGLSSIYSLY